LGADRHPDGDLSPALSNDVVDDADNPEPILSVVGPSADTDTFAERAFVRPM
jgi:hypothetical protein